MTTRIAPPEPTDTRPTLSTCFQAPVLDFKELCRPYVEPVREVLEGKRYRYKLPYGQAIFHFYHGCLMTKALYQGRLYVLPPLSLTDDGMPSLYQLPEHQAHWLEEFLTLPKDLLLFYLHLMKEVFRGRALQGHTQNGQLATIPPALKAFLTEVDWRIW